MILLNVLCLNCKVLKICSDKEFFDTFGPTSRTIITLNGDLMASKLTDTSANNALFYNFTYTSS